MLWFICTAYLIILCFDVKARSEVTLLMMVVLFAVLCLISVASSIDISKRVGKQIVSTMLALCICMQFMYLYDYREGNRTANAIEEGEVYNAMYGDTSAFLVNSVENNGEFYRYDDYSNAITENAAILGNVNSASFYYSVANEYVSEFMQELGLNYTLEQRWLNLDDRYILQSALGCKYTTRKPNLEKAMFYNSTDYSFVRNSKLTLDGSSIAYYKGYSSHESSSKFGVSLTEIKNYLPMGYTYDSVMSREEYEKLSSVNKQNALLQTAVTDDTDVLKNANVRTDNVAEYNLFDLIKENGEITDGIVIKDNTVYVMSTSASITVEVPVKGFSECYMYVNNLDYEDVTSYYAVRNNIADALEKQQEFNDENGLDREATLDRIAELKLKDNKYNYEAAKGINIIANSTYLGKNSLTYYTPMHNFYSGVDTYMVNMGTTPDDITEISTKDSIKLTFSHVATYTMDDWTICYQNLDNVHNDYKARTQDVLENVVISDSENKVSGTISLDETKILATQLPYSKGWSVKVDGKEAEVLDINTMFCGVLLDAGEHTVQFSYVTPYANLAVILTVTGTVMLIATGVYYSLKKKKSKSEDSVETSEN